MMVEKFQEIRLGFILTYYVRWYMMVLNIV